MIKILAGKGTSVQLVDLGMDFGVGVMYDDGCFNGTTYETLEQATEIYNLCQNAIAGYFKKFGTASE